MAGLGTARQGTVWQARQGMARRCMARHCMARQARKQTAHEAALQCAVFFNTLSNSGDTINDQFYTKSHLSAL